MITMRAVVVMGDLLDNGFTIRSEPFGGMVRTGISESGTDLVSAWGESVLDGLIAADLALADYYNRQAEDAAVAAAQ